MTSGDEDDAAAATKPATAAKPAMSRFLRKADSGSSSDEDEDSEDESEMSDEEGQKETKKKSRFLRSDSEGEESDEDVKRVVKSARDKRLDEMEATGKVMDNALKINDWVAISNEFDKLTRMVQRQQNMSEPIPPFYIRTLSSLETSLNSALAKEKEAKKKMNASNARALTAMKQKVKKTAKEYEKELKQFQEDPEAYERQYTVSSAPPVDSAAPKAKKNKAVVDVEEDGDFETVGKGGKSIQFTAEGIFKNLQMIQEARGKKNTDRADQLRILEKLLEVAETPYQRIRVLLGLVSSRFDYNSSVTSYMPLELWSSAQKEIDQLITIVTQDLSYSIQEVTEDYDESVDRSPSDAEGGIVRIRGSMISFIDRLDDEFTKSLQNLDPHGTEYVDRLKDEKGLYVTICRAQALYELKSEPDALARVVMRRLEHIYFKPDAVLNALETAAAASDSVPSLSLASQTTSANLIHSLCVHLYRSGNTLLKTRAMLSHIYHHALQNDFYTARDMLLMSHLQETIYSADVATQILYNRSVVQLGLCAFRCGLIKESQATLQDIFTTQRVKELLAQGVHQQRFQTLTPEQEKAEKQRQLPFHMHVNTELLEAAFLVSSMLVEIPMLASIESEELKRKTISKPFRRLLDFADRQVFTGPPESTRDHIMQASKALQDGQWELCRDLIQGIKIWDLMPETETVKDMLAKRIQEEGLRTYLFTYAPHYKTLSLSLLSRTFSLPLRTVNSIVSKMIWSEELPASLDQAVGVIIFNRVELSRTQQLAQVLAEKVGHLVEQNEKTLDFRLGGTTGWGDRADGAKGEKRGEQTQERRGRGERSRGGSGARGGRGARFAQGLGNQMPATQRVR
ncbi:eukaryotic translation initiation factor 3 subunit 8 [Stereum hirsutum FP-91666 SS1]|uniref:eukaryotic translation initiation factor 3 subunit 8 n=1 Tax=Stereum hirsutum (strain FP-91666) TaxID=721885 RepID=UPI000444A24D|nr:eukaryotic translation initiation factor 3 subunit 8 [Stereum hirsutum FP-91666 SS1]EIM83136.1 eukaryotic translation initiation factor 3 subunit 8 [Stereum hirsutum FP-91666 SS1]